MFVDGKLLDASTGKSRFNDLLGSSRNNGSRMVGSSLFRSSADIKPSIVNSNHKIRFTKEVRFFGNL